MTYRHDRQWQRWRWEELEEAYNEAKKDFDEAAIDLEKARLAKETFLAQLLFGDDDE